jgi:hypothetical protein
MQTAAFAAISLPDFGRVGSPRSFENISPDPPDIIDVPPFERPINPSLSAWSYWGSDISMGVIYTCGYGFNTLYKRKRSETAEQTIPVEPCNGRLIDANVEPATTYCYRLETVTNDGARKNAESCSTTNPARVGFKQLLTTPEESSQVLSEFDWEETIPVSEDTGGQVPQPFIYYMNILVEDDITVPELKDFGVHMQDTPIFPEELSGWHDGLMLAKENNQIIGRWHFAVIPGQLYNMIREQSISDIQAGKAPPIRAVVFRKIPVQAAIKLGPIIDEHQLSYQYLGERGFEFNATSNESKCFEHNGLQVCQTRQPLIGWLVRKLVNFAYDFGTDMADGIRSIIGAYKTAVKGEVSLALQFNMLNMDEAFGLNLPMHSGWSNQEIFLKGVKVHVRQGLAGFYGTTDDQGRVTIQVAKNENTKVCVQAENKYAQLTTFVGRKIVCLESIGKLTANESRTIDASHRYLNVLAQITDAAEYMDTVANHKMAKITVLVGDMANSLAVDDRAFTPCMGRAPSLIGIYTDAFSALVPYLLVVSAGTEFVLSVDIVLPDAGTRSRGVATHEYGHAIMCDMFLNEGLLAFENVWTDVIVGSAFQSTDFPASIIAEGFADYITSQVVGGTNYFPPSDYMTSLEVHYCDAQMACMDEDFTQSNVSDLGNHKPEFKAQIRWLTSILHDAFDGHTETTKPNDGSHWYKSSGSASIIPISGNDSDLNDESITLDGSALVELFKNWVDTGYHTTFSGFLGALAITLSDHNYSEYEICNLFALHSNTYTCPSYISDVQNIPRTDTQVGRQVIQNLGTSTISIKPGEPYNFAPTGIDVNNAALTYSILDKPDWALFDPKTGVLTGTPGKDDKGTSSNVLISVSDGNDTVTLATIDLSVAQEVELKDDTNNDTEYRKYKLHIR